MSRPLSEGTRSTSWLWFALGALSIVVLWVLFYTFDWGGDVLLLLTFAILLVMAGAWGIRKLFAHRAAAKLEKDILGQGGQQAAGSAPERRAEIAELQRNLQEGFASFKSARSKAGKGGRAAIDAVPWYMIIGPPGAGKTTALERSGLTFNGDLGKVRGIGGTRNCDWWFTNEAILLDTAGRYATEAEDRQEWLAFLRFLARHRRAKPIDGILVAIGVDELIDASEEQIESKAKRLRARIDEVATELKIVVPVYVLFTKVDLVAGFTEFFADIKRSDRGKIWGATFPLGDKTTPRDRFESEFDLLVKHAHGRALARCTNERIRDAREKIYRFPVELAGIKQNLAGLVGSAFAHNAYSQGPLLRGFYMVSGTQERTPLNRVLERMSSAMGIRPQDAPQRSAPAGSQPVTEGKSYFLHDVFANVVFKDRDIGALSSVENARRTGLRLGVAGLTLGLAGLIAAPATSSYLRNKAFLEETAKKTKKTAALTWYDDKPLGKKPALLDPTFDLLKKHEQFQTEGPPASMRFGMYSADAVYRPTLELYASKMAEGFIAPCKSELEARLKVADANDYLATRTLLKQYLMLGDAKNLDPEWATGRYTNLWLRTAGRRSDVSDVEMKEKIGKHARFFFDLLSQKKIAPLALDEVLVQRVRRALMDVPVRKRYYDMFVNSLKDERIDEAGEPIDDNLVFPPVRFDRVFAGRPDVLKWFTSKGALAGKGYRRVEGPYTEKGFAAVTKQLERAEGLLETQSWVVPLTAEESKVNIGRHLQNLKTDYERDYIDAWLAFFEDIQIQKPADVAGALELYALIGDAEKSPHDRLLTLLADHTQFRNGSLLDNEAVGKEVNRRFNQKLSTYTMGFNVTVDAAGVGTQLNAIQQRFKATAAFAKQPPKNATDPSASRSTGESKIFVYIEIIRKLREDIEAEKADPSRKKDQLELREVAARIALARSAAEALLGTVQPPDATADTILRPLFMAPLP